MNRRKFILFLAALPLLGFLKPTEAGQSTNSQEQIGSKYIWVDVNGSDENDGSDYFRAVRTLKMALDLAEFRSAGTVPIIILTPSAIGQYMA